jgi:hypothetical protein
MILKIKDKEVELKYSFRSLMLYENIQNKSFTPSTTTDVLVFMYCVIMGSAKDLDFTFDEFLDLVDEDQTLVIKFSNWLTKEINKQNTLSPEEEEDDKKKLKK